MMNVGPISSNDRNTSFNGLYKLVGDSLNEATKVKVFQEKNKISADDIWTFAPSFQHYMVPKKHDKAFTNMLVANGVDYIPLNITPKNPSAIKSISEIDDLFNKFY